MTRSSVGVIGLIGCALAFSAEAVDVPKLKPGLWEMRMSSTWGGANSALPETLCVGAMSDAQRALEKENIKSRCSKYEAKVVGGDLVVDAVCTASSKTVTKHIVTSLSGERFHEENTAPQGSMTSDGRWLSPCKPGEAPDVFK